MKEIQLTHGKVALIDDEDYKRVSQFKWQALYNKSLKAYYASRTSGSKNNRKTIYLARFIMNTPKGMTCDHINHNTLDNRKSNLRNCTNSQNSMNRRTQANNHHSGIKNIYLRRGKYRVAITANHKRVIDRIYQYLDDAVAARDEALNKYHGEFSNTE